MLELLYFDQSLTEALLLSAEIFIFFADYVSLVEILSSLLHFLAFQNTFYPRHGDTELIDYVNPAQIKAK